MRSKYLHPDSPKTFFSPSKKKQVPGRDFCWVSSGGCSRHSPWKLVWKRQHFSEVRHHFWSNKIPENRHHQDWPRWFSNDLWWIFILIQFDLGILFISWGETRLTRKIFQHHLSPKVFGWNSQRHTWKFMFSRFGACDSVPAVLFFVKGIGVFSQKQL